MNKWCEKEIAEMIESVSSCKNTEEVREIFDVVLTPREINDMARRLQIVKMLEDGHSYSEIRMKIGVGSDVIGRISNKIGFGFRRVDAKATKKSVDTKWIDPLSRKKDLYYKGAPSPGTLIRHLKNKHN